MKSQHLLFSRINQSSQEENPTSADGPINVDSPHEIKSENNNSQDDDFEAEMRKFDVKKEENDEEESDHQEKKE